MKKRQPIAFMSYVRFVDEHDEGRLTEFRKRLSGEVRVQTGDEFLVFQDRNDIQWGQNWKGRIEESLDAVTFLIPIITPGFFKSDACRNELQLFLDRERWLNRNDLILPVYYVDCPVFNDEAKRATDRLAQVIAARQYANWRHLRFKPFTSPQVCETLAQLAVQIRDALERVQASQGTAQLPRGSPLDRLYNSGVKAMNYKAWHGAISVFSDVLARDPGYRNAAVLRRVCDNRAEVARLISEGRLKEAKEILMDIRKELREEDPTYWDTKLLLSSIGKGDER